MNDVVHSASGSEFLYAGSGNVWCFSDGGWTADWDKGLDGNGGNDTLIGSGGSDTFVPVRGASGSVGGNGSTISRLNWTRY